MEEYIPKSLRIEQLSSRFLQSKWTGTPCFTSDVPFLTKTLLENIHRNEWKGHYTKLADAKISSTR